MMMAYIQVVQGLLLSFILLTFAEGQSASGYSRNLGWGPWTGWSVCNKKCGYGTAYRIRTCHRQYSNSIQESCEGPSKQYKICIIKDCPDKSHDFRWRECTKHNSVYYGRQRYTWVPYINDASPCELACKSLGFGYYARFSKTVADGVTCNYENTALCMAGKCITSGCDGILESDTKLDRCGVCGGDGNSCKVVKGIFTRTHLTHRGYNIVTTIPAGARSINVTEMRRSRNYLALSTPNGYFLNGEMRLRPTGTINGAGTTFTYTRGAGVHCPGECLTAPGPLNTSLRVEIIYFGRNPGILYDYTVPRSDNKADRVASPGTQGSASNSVLSPSPTPHDLAYGDAGGAGVGQPQQVLTIDRGRQRIRVGLTPTFVPPDSGGNAAVSGDVRPRSRSRSRDSLRRRDYRVRSHRGRDGRNDRKYNTSPYHPSRSRDGSVRTPGGGREDPDRTQLFLKVGNSSVQYRHYYHTNAHDNLGDVPMVKPASDGDKTSGSTKANRENTNRRQRPSYMNANDAYDSRYAEFRSNTQYQRRAFKDNSETSAPFGVRSNNVIPAPTRDRSNNVIPAPTRDRDSVAARRGYTNTKQETRPSGYRNDYNLYQWKISGFTPCSESCGGGLQDTRVVCVKSDSQVEVIEENCDPSKTPESTTIVCNTQPCKARWSVSDWTPCSVTCGRGLQKRTVECRQRISSTLTIDVSPGNCPPLRPPYRQYCQMEPCFKWAVSGWGECSTQCGFGQRTRSVTCVDTDGSEVSSRMCPQLRPDTEEICDKGSCAQGWFHTRWSEECSAECGRGYYTRQVYCSASDGSSLDEKKCGDSKSRPRDRKRCKAAKPCGGKWFAGTWSACNATCGSDAERRRDVLCVKRHGKRLNHVVKEHNCDPETKPAIRESCGPFPECSPQWFIMSWSQCSKSCGTGVRTREVKCIDSTLTPSADCDKRSKPSRRQSCNTHPCKVEPDISADSSPQEPSSANLSDNSSIKASTKNATETLFDSGENITDSGGTTASPTADEKLQRDDSAQQGSAAVEERKPGRGKNIPSSSAEEDKSICQDKNDARWCQMARQARLCGYQHYRDKCCRTCGYSKPIPH